MTERTMPTESGVKVSETKVYIFDCPVHGPERTVFCQRAYQKHYRHLWVKCIEVLTTVSFADGELYLLMNSMGVASP